MTYRSGLSAGTAAFGFHVDVETRCALRRFERLTHDLLQRLAREVLVDRPFIDRNDALSERNADARDRALTTAGTLKIIDHDCSYASGCGCGWWAAYRVRRAR